MKKIRLSLFCIFALITFLGNAQNVDNKKSTQEKGKFRLAFSGGFSYRLASLKGIEDEILKSHAKKLKSGYGIAVDAGVEVNPDFIIGLRYSAHHAKHRLNNIVLTYDDGSKEYGYILDDVEISFVGATFTSLGVSSNEKHQFSYGSGIGYVGYKNDSFYVTNEVLLKGGTLGFSIDVGYEYFIVPQLSLGIQTSLFTGGINKVKNGEKVIELDDESRISLSRLDAMVGLRLYM